MRHRPDCAVDDTRPPVAPTVVLATATRAGTAASATTPVDVAWNAGSDQDQFSNPRALAGYRVFRKLAPAGVPVDVSGLLASTALTFTDTGAAANVAYLYSVTSVDLTNNTSASADVGATTFSSFRSNVNPIWAARGCAAAGCHGGPAAPALGGTAAQNLAAIGTARTTPNPGVANAKLLCWPAGQCPSMVAPLTHTGGMPLTQTIPPADPVTAQQIAYAQIYKWISEGAVDN